MGARSVLIVAELSQSEQDVINRDCENCNFDVTWLTSADMLSSKLIGEKFDTLVVHLQTPGAARACVEARTALSRVRFPIMALTDEVDDSTYNKAFKVGADDVVNIKSSAQISQRLAAIPKASWKPVGRSRGEALIVDPDKTRADALGRLLKEAGFLVKSVRDAPTAKLHLGRQSVRLVVCDDTTLSVAPLIKDGNRREWRPAWIVRTRPSDFDRVSGELAAFHNAAAVNVYLSASDVLYEANRLSNAQHEGPRFLYGTTVEFSTDRSNWKEQGFCFAVGENELMVRTLALPPSMDLSLELVAPGTEQRVLLEGELSERRVFGPLETQIAPPGFSVRLTGGVLETWRQAYRKAYRERFGVDAPEASDIKGGDASTAQEGTAIGRVQLRSASDSQARRARAATLKSAKSDPDPPTPMSEGPGTKPGVAPPPGLLQADVLPTAAADAALSSSQLAEPQRKSPRTRLGLGLLHEGSNIPEAKASTEGVAEAPMSSPSSAPNAPSAQDDSGETSSVANAGSNSSDDLTAPVSTPTTKSDRDQRDDTSQAGRSTLLSAPASAAGDSAPSDSAPSDSAPSDSAPSDSAPSDSAPSDVARARATSADSKPDSAHTGQALDTSTLDAEPSERNAAAPGQDAPGGARDSRKAPAETGSQPQPQAATERHKPPTARETTAPRGQTQPGKQAVKTSKPPKTRHTSKRPPASAATEATAPAEKPKGSAALLVVLGLLVAGAAAAFLTAQPTTPKPPAADRATAQPANVPPPAANQTATLKPVPSPTALPRASATQPADSGSIEEPATPTEQGQADPNAAASADAASSEDSDSAPALVSDAPNPSQLPGHLGYLFVASSLDTQVFVQGKLAGKTNQRLKSFCGSRYVRLGTAPGRWQSKGFTTRIRCQAENRLEIEPD